MNIHITCTECQAILAPNLWISHQRRFHRFETSKNCSDCTFISSNFADIATHCLLEGHKLSYATEKWLSQKLPCFNGTTECNEFDDDEQDKSERNQQTDANKMGDHPATMVPEQSFERSHLESAAEDVSFKNEDQENIKNVTSLSFFSAVQTNKPNGESVQIDQNKNKAERKLMGEIFLKELEKVSLLTLKKDESNPFVSEIQICQKCSYVVSLRNRIASQRIEKLSLHVRSCFSIRPFACSGGRSSSGCSNCKFAAAQRTNVVRHIKLGKCGDAVVEMVDRERHIEEVKMGFSRCFPKFVLSPFAKLL